MSYLIDTHTFLWFADDVSKLSTQARVLLEDESISISVSMASFWEISIKNSLGKLRLDAGFNALLDVAQKNGFEVLHMNFSHTALVNRLPFHHGDPFDRMIVAQAIVEGLDIIGNDKMFDHYLENQRIKRVW